MKLPIVREPDTDLHIFRSSLGLHLFMANGSRIFDIESNNTNCINNNNSSSSSRTQTEPSSEELSSLQDLVLESVPRKRINKHPLNLPSLSSLSLNVAQLCNMSCGYCYADSGKFGGSARLMSEEVAQASVDRLIVEASPGADLVLGYMGGEPLLNRKIVHGITRYAANAAQKSGHRILSLLQLMALLSKKRMQSCLLTFRLP